MKDPKLEKVCKNVNEFNYELCSYILKDLDKKTLELQGKMYDTNEIARKTIHILPTLNCNKINCKSTKVKKYIEQMTLEMRFGTKTYNK